MQISKASFCPGWTGVKGVIRDGIEANSTARDKRALEIA